MDTKSLAKSKRAHTLHHNKKHHPNQKVKPAAPSTVGTSATDKAPVKEKPRGPASLPSNWDRYEEEDDSMTKNQIEGQSSSRTSDVVVPKSNGADYAYLISEAKSQRSSTMISPDIFPSLDDFLSDFGLGKDPYFAVRGESLVLSIQNDSFFVDDKAPASYEASFLSLNLQALSEQLAKIDLRKRLFIESDLFPLDQYSEGGQEGQNLSQYHDNASIHESQANTRSTSLKQPTSNPYPKSVAKPSENQSKLQSETADAELDMLLESFADTSLTEKVSMEKTVAFDIDTTLDDLLKETSTPSPLDQKQSHEVKSIPVASKSELLDDFDSWLDTI